MFANALQLGAHNRVCTVDAVSRNNINAVSQREIGSINSDDSDSENIEHDVTTLVVTQPAPLHTLARRAPRPWGRVVAMLPPQLGLSPRNCSRDYRELQSC